MLGRFTRSEGTAFVGNALYRVRTHGGQSDYAIQWDSHDGGGFRHVRAYMGKNCKRAASASANVSRRKKKGRGRRRPGGTGGEVCVVTPELVL